MEIDYKILGIGAGIAIGGTLLYKMIKGAIGKRKEQAKSLDDVMAERLDLPDTFGEATYIQKEI